jgi:hypothetical protein
MIEPRKQVNNIYGYIRVSSEQQAKDGSSLDEDLLRSLWPTNTAAGKSISSLPTLA